MVIKKTIQGLIFFMFSQYVFASVDETGKIIRLIVEGNAIVSVWLNGTDVNTECSGGSRWTLQNSNDGLFKEKLAMLLAAAASGEAVHLHHLTAWGCGNWNSNRIYYVDVVF